MAKDNEEPKKDNDKANKKKREPAADRDLAKALKEWRNGVDSEPTPDWFDG